MLGKSFIIIAVSCLFELTFTMSTVSLISKTAVITTAHSFDSTSSSMNLPNGNQPQNNVTPISPNGNQNQNNGSPINSASTESTSLINNTKAHENSTLSSSSPNGVSLASISEFHGNSTFSAKVNNSSTAYAKVITTLPIKKTSSSFFSTHFETQFKTESSHVNKTTSTEKTSIYSSDSTVHPDNSTHKLTTLNSTHKSTTVETTNHERKLKFKEIFTEMDLIMNRMEKLAMLIKQVEN